MVTLASFKYALRGIRAVVSSERNAKVHILFAILAIGLAIVLQISTMEFLFVFFTILLVFFAEIINTAIEKTLDLISQENNHMVQRIKDMMAGAVLVTAVAAVVVAVVIFGPHLWQLITTLKK